MFCENCGTKLPDNSLFCEECGHEVSFLEDETQIKEENLNIKKKSGSIGQRGAVPPVMRPKSSSQPSQSNREETKLYQSSEHYEKQTKPLQPSETYEKQMAKRQPTTISKLVSDGFEYKKTNCQNVDIISFGQYVGMIFLAGIPIINIIVFVKWGFFNKQKPNKSNFAKALLFYYFIAVIIYIAYIWLWLKATSSI